MSFIHVFLIFNIIVSLTFAELASENVIFAINCGGDDFHDAKGIEWQKVDNIN